MKFRRADTIPRSGLVAGVAGTALIHAVVIGLGLLGMMNATSSWKPTIYAVELVAAPRPAVTAPASPTAAPTPPAPPVVNPTPKPTTKTAPIPKVKPPAKVDPKVEPVPPKATPAPAPAPGATPSTGSDVDNVRVAGAAFPYPDYLRNIMNQILRRWARPKGVALTAEVSFTIGRDGSVGEIKVISSSKSYSFDLEAQGAIEQAGADKAFGPLPTGWNSDILKVAFLFTPRPQ
jgi:protein TonB